MEENKSYDRNLGLDSTHLEKLKCGPDALTTMEQILNWIKRKLIVDGVNDTKRESPPTVIVIDSFSSLTSDDSSYNGHKCEPITLSDNCGQRVCIVSDCHVQNISRDRITLLEETIRKPTIRKPTNRRSLRDLIYKGKFAYAK